MRKFIVTGFGTGHLPVAPGTWGSAAAVAVFLLVAHLSDGNAILVNGAMGVVAAASSVACVGLGRFAEEAFGTKDPSECTIDEWAGQALTFVLLPMAQGPVRLLIIAAAGFVAFRLFDIVKPPPARGLQRLPAGWGILVDDLIAAVYANVICQLVFRLALHW